MIILALCKRGYTFLWKRRVDLAQGGMCNLFLGKFHTKMQKYHVSHGSNWWGTYLPHPATSDTVINFPQSSFKLIYSQLHLVNHHLIHWFTNSWARLCSTFPLQLVKLYSDILLKKVLHKYVEEVVELCSRTFVNTRRVLLHQQLAVRVQLQWDIVEKMGHW